MQIIESSQEYDVIIVGSGAGGGMATKILSEAGLKVAVVEAGPFFDPADPDQITQLKWPYESPRRGASTTRPFGDFDSAYGGWDIEGEPYSHSEGTDFKWFRSRMLGGRTNHWGRISLRFGPKDFKRKDQDGFLLFPQFVQTNYILLIFRPFSSLNVQPNTLYKIYTD